MVDNSRYSSPIGVCVLVQRDDGALLLLERAGTGYADGSLSTPGGHVEQGESFVEAAVREVREEVDVLVEPHMLRFAHVMHQRDADAQARVIVFFEALHWSGEPTNREPELCAGLHWAKPDTLPSMVIPCVADAITMAQAGQPFSLRGW
ncbi:NUDIX domain-containing protein [Amycolatopsis sp. cg5]|uniref:NUDIX hydrolase n=1 Tax=Amycolatopsis sp. cg5 TaxID=3238802 RepID=UPI003526A6FB